MTEVLMLELRGVSVSVRPRRDWWARKAEPLTILDSIDLAIAPGTAFGLVGASGAGKTTLFRTIVGLQRPDAGEVLFEGVPFPPKRSREQHRAIQTVFQDPFSSLNPRKKVGSVIAELLRVHEVVPKAEVEAEVGRLLAMVGLPESAADQLPRRFSGGQRQRIAIARALAVRPRLLLADEPVSALDVSVQAGVLKLLKDLQRRLGLTVIFVSHDLAVVRQFCDEAAVLQKGRIVERGSTRALFEQPHAEITKELVEAIPKITDMQYIDGDARSR